MDQDDYRYAILTRRFLLNTFFTLFCNPGRCECDQPSPSDHICYESIKSDLKVYDGHRVGLNDWSKLNKITAEKLRSIPPWVWTLTSDDRYSNNPAMYMMPDFIREVKSDSSFAQSFWYAIGFINEALTRYVEECIARRQIKTGDAKEFFDRFFHQDREHILARLARTHGHQGGILRRVHGRETSEAARVGRRSPYDVQR